MTKLSIAFLAALSLTAACKKKDGAGDGPDCTAAITHSLDLAKPDMVKMGVDDKMMAKMRDTGIQRCTEDKWAPEAVKCMVDAKAEADAQGCYDKLTKDQQDKMNKAAMALQPTPPAPPPAPTPTEPAPGGSAAPAAGSDMGSGSAAAPAAGSDMGSGSAAAAPK